MADVIQETITIRVSKLVKTGTREDGNMVADEKLPLIEATLEEVLDMPDCVIEVERE